MAISLGHYDKKRYALSMLHAAFSLIVCTWPIVSGAYSFANDRQNVAIIHSYSSDYEWTHGQHQGILSAAQSNNLKLKGWTLHQFFLDSKRVNDLKEMDAKIGSIKTELANRRISAAVLTDDFAFMSFYSYFKKRAIPVAFSGVNDDIAKYSYSTGDRFVTGSLERYNVPATLKILKRLRPSLSKVLLISEPDITGRAMLLDFKKQFILDRSSGFEFEEFVSASYEELKEKLFRVDPKTTAVFFVAFYTYKDAHGKHVDYRTIDNWIRINTEFLDVGTAQFNVRRGRLLSLASDPIEMGRFAFEQLISCLSDQCGSGPWPMRETLPLQLTVNRRRAKQLGIKLPFELLSYSKSFEE